MNDINEQRYWWRGGGATTKQLKEAPHGSVFVWVNGNLDYPIQLAKHLGRDDIKIVSPSWVSYKNVAGVRKNIILDHASHLSSKQMDIYFYNQACIEASKDD